MSVTDGRFPYYGKRVSVTDGRFPYYGKRMSVTDGRFPKSFLSFF